MVITPNFFMFSKCIYLALNGSGGGMAAADVFT